MLVCVLLVSNRSAIVFNPIAGAITDHRQSAKDVDPHFKSQLCVEDPGQRKPVLILQKGLSKPGERAHDRHFISAMGAWDSNRQPLDRQSSVLPLSYHRSLETIMTDRSGSSSSVVKISSV